MFSFFYFYFPTILNSNYSYIKNEVKIEDNYKSQNKETQYFRYSKEIISSKNQINNQINYKEIINPNNQIKENNNIQDNKIIIKTNNQINKQKKETNNIQDNKEFINPDFQTNYFQYNKETTNFRSPSNNLLYNSIGGFVYVISYYFDERFDSLKVILYSPKRYVTNFECQICYSNDCNRCNCTKQLKQNEMKNIHYLLISLKPNSIPTHLILNREIFFIDKVDITKQYNYTVCLSTFASYISPFSFIQL